MQPKLSTLEYLRNAFALARNTRGDVVDAFTPLEWLALYDAYRASEWDFTPCQWEGWQRTLALKGIVPQWDSNERPIPPTVKTEFLNIQANGFRCPACNAKGMVGSYHKPGSEHACSACGCPVRI